jgi:H+/Cl- antiporter ClcA
MQANDLLHDPRVLRAQKNLLLNLPFWIGAGLTALVSVGYSMIFKVCEEWALNHAATTTILWTAPLALLVSFGLGHFLAKDAIGSGIPQVIACVEVAKDNPPFIKKILGLPMLVAKISGSCLCVLGGGVVGREGPTLQVSAAIFYQISRFWPKKLSVPSLQGMILAGGAAGLASAFNTPLGGVVFAIEELSKTHVSAVRTSVFQAVIIAGIMAQLFLGNYLYLGDTHFGTFPMEVLVQTGLIAGLVGFVGAGFAELLYQITKWRGRKSLRFKILMTLICGGLLSLTIFLMGPSTVGAGKSVMAGLMQNPTELANPALPAARILGSFFTYISGAVGGIFAPALASGAALGQILAQLMGFAAVKLMILVGMVAFLTGITRTPFTSFVLVLEMSNSHDVILYLMLASLIANISAKLVNGKSFYELAAHDILARNITPAVPEKVPATPASPEHRP